MRSTLQTRIDAELDLRRRQLFALLTAVGLQQLWSPGVRAASANFRLLIIGGGFGGALAARLLKRLLPLSRISLIEPNASLVACPFSNLVLVGLRQLNQQTFTHEMLAREGVEVIRDLALQVDPEKKKVRLKGGSQLTYDRLIMSPGIDFRWGALEGYDEQATARMPHAWKSGQQLLLLRDQLKAMPEGGTLLLCVTAAPFRCPPGPYERASLLAGYLQKHKPGSKLIILDSNERFSKQQLFMQAWQKLYPNLVEWRSATNDGRVVRVDANRMLVHTDFDAIHGEVVNVIPPQQAGLIAIQAGVADESGWCPVDPLTFESRLVPGIHVVGDATLAAPMPKSAFAANMQAKICALQMARTLTGLPAEPTTLINTCFSFVSKDEAVSISATYHNGKDKLTQASGGTTPLDAKQEGRHQEAIQARDWFRTITAETFGA